MASKTLTVTVPEALYEAIEQRRVAGHYTRSELVREALRRYFNLPIPEVDPEPDEIEAIREGMAAFERGEYVTLEEFEAELAAEEAAKKSA